MKHLITSTALAAILATPAWAQDQQQSADQAFLQSLQSGDILISELVGQDIYASSGDTGTAAETEGSGDEAMQTGEVDENGTDQDAQVTDLETDDDAQAQADDAQDQAEDTQAQSDDAQDQAQDMQAQSDDAQDQAQDMQAQADDTQDQAQQQVGQDQQQTGEMRTISSDQLEGMETLGQVSEVVIDQQGEARGIVLQVDNREVAVDMQQISFAFDQDDPDQVYIIAQVGQQELEQAPEFQRERMAEAADQDVQAEQTDQQAEETDQQTAQEETEPAQESAQAQQDTEPSEETGAIPQDADEQWRGDRQAFAQPEVQREGMQRAESGQVSVDNLIGATVYDTQDNNIGDINDVVAGENDELQFVVVDVGGFLGIGTHTVALGLDEVTILHDEGWDDVQVYVDATEEQLENLPEYAQN